MLMAVKQRAIILIVMVTVLACVFTVKLFSVPGVNVWTQNAEVQLQLVEEYIRQRNHLSRMLNSNQQIVGQIECEKLIKNPVATSSTGGWCANASYEDSGKHITDKKVIPALAKLFTGKYVASFGDGPGRYKQLLLETTLLKGYDAYDGAPYTEKTSDGRVKFLDLTIPQYGLPLYDWVVSLEVAEHIPQQFESVYIDNIIRHARDGIVISWAIPGQEGYSHVNNRKHEYVQEIIESKGFTYIPNESQTLKNSSWLGSFKNHLSVYRRRDLNKIIEEQLNQNA